MPDNLVTVATFQFLPAAEASRLRLEEEGISVFLADVNTVSIDWFLGNAVGYIKLQVPLANASHARQILDEMEAQRGESADSEDEIGSDRCLACGAILPDDADKCPACGWSYAEGRSDAAN